MAQLIIDLLYRNLKDYKENLEILELTRQEIKEKLRDSRKTLKSIEELQAKGITVEVPKEMEDLNNELNQIETEIKVLNSIIRRYGTVMNMYELNVFDGEVVDSEHEQITE